ncbi:MAG: hypothetical protein JNL79_14555 [Myxococcales bacterium]|nr:hypothetical protein [Myxococcales bacterium]
MSHRALSLFVALTLATPWVHADAAFDKSQSAALFKEGKKLLDQGKFDEACPKLAESHKIDPGGGVVLALALCLEGQGKLASAVVAYREAQFLAKRDKRADRQKAAGDKLAELEPKLSHLTVRVDPAAQKQGVVVRVDGNVLPTASYGLSVAVDGGKHEIEARAEGFESKTSTVDVGNANDNKELSVAPLTPKATDPTKPPSPDPTPPKPEPAPAPRASIVPTIGVGVGVVGVVALLAGGFFGIRTIRGAHDIEAACPDGVCRDPADVDRNDTVKRDARIADVLLISGAVLAVAGVTLYVVGRPGSSKAVGLSPAVGPQGLGFSLSARF